jgi:hypothetical protein
MFLIGLFIIAFGVLLWFAIRYPIWLTGGIGSFNILLGIITPRSRKVDLQPEPSGMVKLVVDKVQFRNGKVRFSDCELVFLDNRLVMKKLFSWRAVMILGVVFALIGGFVGFLTAVSMEEFLDQRKRDRIRDRNELTTLNSGDTEISYESMSEVQLTGFGLRAVVGGRLLLFNVASEYPPLMARRVRETIPSHCWARPS